MFRGFVSKYLTGESFNLRRIMSIYVPVLLEQISVNFASMLNSIFVASASVSVFAAVSLVETINVLVMSVFIALATGGAVVVSQYVGKREKESTEKSVVQVMLSTTLFAGALGAILHIFKVPLTNALFGSVDGETMGNVRTYLTVCCATYPLSGFLNSGIAVLRGSGKTKASAMLVILMAVWNLVTSIIFIKILNWGLDGLMLNLIMVRIVGVIWTCYYVFKMYPNILKSLKKLCKWDNSMQKSIVSIGVPTAMEQMFFNGGKMLIQTFVVGMGTSAVVVNAITNSVTNIIYLPGNAVLLCATTVIGTCIGAGNKKEAKRMVIGLMGLSTFLLLIACLVATPLLPWVISLYTSVPAEIELALHTSWITMIGYVILWSPSFLMPAGIRAAGDAKFVTITAFASMWAFRVVMGYILGVSLGFGLYGVYIAMVTEWAVRSSIFYWRYKGDKWLEKVLV